MLRQHALMLWRTPLLGSCRCCAMGETLDQPALERWQREPTRFIEEVLRDPETGRPFQLLPCERRFLEHAFTTDDNGRLLYPEQCYSGPKKIGKTAFSAMNMIVATLVFGGPFAEGYCVANIGG